MHLLISFYIIYAGYGVKRTLIIKFILINLNNDDTQYLRAAFNSGVANIDMPKCEYKITDRINLTQHQLI